MPRGLLIKLWNDVPKKTRRLVAGFLPLLALVALALASGAAGAAHAPRRQTSLALLTPWRQYHVVNIDENGVTMGIVTKAATVAGVLKRAGIRLGPGEYITPAVDAHVLGGQTIQVATVTHRILTRSVAIPYQVKTTTNPNLAPGLSQVVKSGRAGLKTVTDAVIEAGSKVLSSAVIAQKVISPPQTEILAVGPASGQTASYSGPYVKKIYVEETAYWANPAWSNGYTYTGVKAAIGSIAVDPRVIPLGTRLFVNGYGYGVADDIGGAIKGYHIDLFFPTKAEVDAWGMRFGWIYILPAQTASANP